MKTSPKQFLFPFFIFSVFVFLSFQVLAHADNSQKDEVRNDNADSALRNLERNKGNFPVPNDFERDVSAGLGADVKAGESINDATQHERGEIDERYDSHDWEERKHNRDKLKAADDTKAIEDARKDNLAKLDQAGLDRGRTESQRAIDYFNQINGPSDKWTPEQNEQYNQLVIKNAILTQPTAAESKDLDKHQQVRDDVHNQIKAAAYNMGKMTDDEVRERLQAAQTADALTKTWRDFTFTGQMYSHTHQDIHNQREIGIKANSMIIAAQLYLRQPGLTAEQRKIAQQILNTNKMVRGHAADAISKDLALVALGVTADAGMMGVGKFVSKAVGAVSGWIGGGTKAAGGVAPAAAGASGEAGAAGGKAAATEAGGQAGAKVAGTEAGGQAGAKAAGQEAAQGGKLPHQMNPAEAQAYQNQLSDKAITNVENAGQKIADIAKDKSVVMPPEASVAAAESKAVQEGVKKLTQAEIDKLFEKGANLTSEQAVQKAELLAQGYKHVPPTAPGTPPAGFNHPPPSWTEGATLGGGQQASGATQGFNKVLPLPVQGAGQAAGGTTQAFKGVLPLPGGGGTTAASEAATVSGNLTGNTAGGGTQAFKGVLPIPGGGGATAASEAATVSGNLTGGQAGGTTQAFNKVLPIPKK